MFKATLAEAYNLMARRLVVREDVKGSAMLERFASEPFWRWNTRQAQGVVGE